MPPLHSAHKSGHTADIPHVHLSSSRCQDVENQILWHSVMYLKFTDCPTHLPVTTVFTNHTSLHQSASPGLAEVWNFPFTLYRASVLCGQAWGTEICHRGGHEVLTLVMWFHWYENTVLGLAGAGAKAFPCIHRYHPSRRHVREACLLIVPWRVEASLGAALPWVQASCGLCFDRTSDSWSRGPCLGRSRSETGNPQRGTPGSLGTEWHQERAPHIKVLLFPPLLFSGYTSALILGYVVLTGSGSPPPKPHPQEHPGIWVEFPPRCMVQLPWDPIGEAAGSPGWTTPHPRSLWVGFLILRFWYPLPEMDILIVSTKWVSSCHVGNA